VRAVAAARTGHADLAARGAERGAAALARLVGGEPRAGRIHPPGLEALAGYETGAFFALGGAIEGSVAVLFPAQAREGLLRALGAAALADPGSALCEVANIVASQAVCAIAERLEARVRLSVPRPAPHGAGVALARAIGDGPAFASELGAPPVGARALLVLVPGAPPPGCDTVGE
jgi:hypothetical protein